MVPVAEQRPRYGASDGPGFRNLDFTPDDDLRPLTRRAEVGIWRLPQSHTAKFTVTLLRWVKLSSMPSSENSRPMPLCL